jgi:hypothetical protein
MTYNDLKHYNFHWLWGLQFHESPPTENFEQIFDSFKSDPKKWQEVQENIERVARFNFFVRLFYQIFNIQNYSLNLAIMNVLKKINEKSQAPKDESNPSFWGFFCTNSSRILNSFWGEPTSQQTSREIENEMPVWRDSPASEPREAIESSFIRVGYMVQPHLKILGLTKAIGDTVTLEEIIKAYKKKSLKAHPDRGGSTEEFQTLQASVTFLKDQFVATCYESLDEIIIEDLFRQLYEEIIPELEKFIAESQANRAKLNDLKADVEQLEKQNAAMAEFLKNLESGNGTISPSGP